MIIKVCGMRDADNIRQLEQTDIDWMGFIFFPGSPRFVGLEMDYLPLSIKKVGVFVDQDLQAVREVVGLNRLDMVQLHGSEPPWYCANLREEGYRIIKAFGIKGVDSLPLARLHAYEGNCDYFMFDTKTTVHGGSGIKFDWRVLDNYKGDTPFILSGGISSEDIEIIRAIKHPKFVGIDINSRFEIAPAMKDSEKIKTFIGQLRKM